LVEEEVPTLDQDGELMAEARDLFQKACAKFG